MAQRRPRHHRHGPSVVSPLYSLQVLAWAVVAFLVLIGLMVVVSILPGNNSTTTSKTTRAAAAVAASSSQQHQHRLFTSPNDIPSSIISVLDAILVLGGGVPESVDRPPIYVERRCDDALAVVARRLQENSSNQRLSTSTTSLPILCLSAGTAHLPQLMGADGLPVWESTACAAYLENHAAQQQHNIQPIPIFVETTSYDTIGNAYYTRVSHTDINDWKTLLVITNEFHMDRTMAIFDWVFGATNDNGSNSPGGRLRQQGYRLFFLASPNVGLTIQAIDARKEREAQSAVTVRTQLAPKYTSLKQIYHFLTHEHALYSAHSLVERGRGTISSSNTNNNKGASWAVKQSYGGTSSHDGNPK